MTTLCCNRQLVDCCLLQFFLPGKPVDSCLFSSLNSPLPFKALCHCCCCLTAQKQLLPATLLHCHHDSQLVFAILVANCAIVNDAATALQCCHYPCPCLAASAIPQSSAWLISPSCCVVLVSVLSLLSLLGPWYYLLLQPPSLYAAMMHLA